MQLAQRKIKILKAIVEAYIENGEPVGSKALCNTLDFPVSSATVRNEMAELSELGLLTQPHTSAGRVPSEDGYRFYVESLMEKKKLRSDIKALIYDTLSSSSDDPEKLLNRASEIVAQLTKSAVISTTPSSENARIRCLKFVQTGRQTCMVVLITSTGLIKTRLFKCDYMITPDIIRIYETIFNRNMEGLPLRGITPAFVQTMAVEMGELAMLVPSVLTAIMEACDGVSSFSMAVSGKVNLLFNDESDFGSMRALTAFLHSDEDMESLVLSLRNSKSIVIGSEIGLNALRDYSVLSQPYSIEMSSGGLIAAIVPMRSDYAFVMSVLEYTAECVGRLLRSLLMIDSE